MLLITALPRLYNHPNMALRVWENKYIYIKIQIIKVYISLSNKGQRVIQKSQTIQSLV